jgi:hypothetical protein
MSAQKRIEDTEGEEFAHHLDRACACLEHDSWKGALRKDFHLVRSALASGQTIISNENRFPLLVATACRTIQEFSSLYYANPAAEGDACILWIKAGAEKDTVRRIDVWAENHQKIDQ